MMIEAYIELSIMQGSQNVFIPKEMILFIIMKLDLGASILGQEDVVTLLEGYRDQISVPVTGTWSHCYHLPRVQLGDLLREENTSSGFGRRNDLLHKDPVQARNQPLRHCSFSLSLPPHHQQQANDEKQD
eukprot:TRINITY_DN3322_c0_g1_i1.p1 TRINITY_DN3322_c0_g1~~TRINITY_DN3322_c0_g1_i1.p1  ORF type:complete len:130 (-),score=29.70 TRINITY_DN3322_c0_g1_i1:127-516(-)